MNCPPPLFADKPPSSLVPSGLIQSRGKSWVEPFLLAPQHVAGRNEISRGA